MLLLDDDTVRIWHSQYEEDGIESLANFGCYGSPCRLSDKQWDKLEARITDALPRSTREVGAWIKTECGIAYPGRSGLTALLHPLGMERHKPRPELRKLDPTKQAAFVRAYEDPQMHLGEDEAALFGEAVRPTHAVRPVGCWAPKDIPIAVAQTSGRQSLNVHGAINLGTGQTRIPGALEANAASTIMLIMATAAMYPSKHDLPLDDAQYQLAKPVQAWVLDQTAFHPSLLPASRSIRATMGPDTQPHLPQPVPRNIRRLKRHGPDVRARGGAQKAESILLCHVGQFPRHLTQKLSDPGTNGVIIKRKRAHNLRDI